MTSKSKAIRDINKKYFNKGINPKSLENLKTESPWINKPTIAIRVPEKFKEQVLAYAHDLDKDSNPQNNASNIAERLKIILSTKVRKSQGTEVIKAKIRELLDEIDSSYDET